jgi:hypothetical protein
MNDPQEWVPNPVNTDDVHLPPDIYDVVDALAKAAHDEWGLERRLEGWRYGPKHDGEARTNPFLVPYEDLPESEKECDRQRVIKSLKLLIRLGFRIEPTAQPGNGNEAPKPEGTSR